MDPLWSLGISFRSPNWHSNANHNNNILTTVGGDIDKHLPEKENITLLIQSYLKQIRIC